MAQYHTLLLDADNTLFDFDRSEQEALEETFTARGFQWDDAAWTRYEEINRALWDSFDRGEINRSWLTVERFTRFQRQMLGEAPYDGAQWNEDFQNALGRRPYLLPQAQEVCEKLSAECRLYIVTNGLAAAQRRVEISALSPFLSGIFISETMGCQKPERRFFDMTFQKAGLTEEDKPWVLMVGDNLVSDVKGGTNYGLDTVWLQRPGQELIPTADPTYIIHQLCELEEIVL